MLPYLSRIKKNTEAHSDYWLLGWLKVHIINVFGTQYEIGCVL